VQARATGPTARDGSIWWAAASPRVPPHDRTRPVCTSGSSVQLYSQASAPPSAREWLPWWLQRSGRQVKDATDRNVTIWRVLDDAKAGGSEGQVDHGELERARGASRAGPCRRAGSGSAARPGRSGPVRGSCTTRSGRGRTRARRPRRGSRLPRDVTALLDHMPCFAFDEDFRGLGLTIVALTRDGERLFPDASSEGQGPARGDGQRALTSRCLILTL
jgi:hypothetical protein